jgi:hypothetical protein
MGIKQFAIEAKATIETHTTWKPKLLRRNDRNLMDIVDQLDMTKGQKKIFNNWSLYFGAVTISNMTNAKGDTIDKHYLDKSEVYKHGKNTCIIWPNQEQPHISTFTIWRNTLQKAFAINKDGKLSRPLGEWIVKPLKYMKSQYILDKTKRILLSIESNIAWREHKLINERRGRFYFNRIGEITAEPDGILDYIPVDCEVRGETLVLSTRLNRISYKDAMEEPTEAYHNFKEYVNEKYKNKPGGIKIQDYEEDIILGETLDKLSICSDGGLKDNVGSYGLVIGQDQQIILNGYKRTKTT